MIEFNETELSNVQISNSAYTYSIDVWNNQFSISGPGSGVLISLPVSGNLKLSVSTSLLYFYMDFQGYFLNDTSGNTVSANKSNYSYRGLGNNSTLVFSYYIPSMDTAFNAGVRFQYLNYKEEGDPTDLYSDLNYGFIFTAMYFF